MTAQTAKAALVDPAALENGANVIATQVPRSEIEEALETGTTSELFLDVAREREGEREAEQRITVSWEPADLEKLLGSTTGDEVTFAFKADELARMFDEPDVEAQGLRERMAILTVAATTAAGISAGVAAAMPANLVGESVTHIIGFEIAVESDFPVLKRVEADQRAPNRAYASGIVLPGPTGC